MSTAWQISNVEGAPIWWDFPAGFEACLTKAVTAVEIVDERTKRAEEND